MRHRTLIALLLVWSSPTAAMLRAAEVPAPQAMQTPEGVKFGLWPARPKAPAPTLVILSGAWQDSLGSETYRKAGTQLAERGYLCVSLDLPCHGEFELPKEKGLTGWRSRANRDDDFVAELTDRVTKLLDFLIVEKLADPERLAVCGTSRGGFMALHCLLADSRLKCAAAYAPVVDLAALSEFRGGEKLPLVRRTALIEHADALAERGVWIIIGDRDERVDTNRAIGLARKISAAAAAKMISPRVDLHVLSSAGHTTPAGASELSAAWIDVILNPQPQ